MKNFLKKAESIAVKKFINRVTKRFRRRIQSIILFGSKLTGSFNQDSDIDVFVIINGRTDGIAKKIVGIAFDIMLEEGSYIPVKVFDRNKIKRLNSQGDIFIRNVLNKGEELWLAK